MLIQCTVRRIRQVSLSRIVGLLVALALIATGGLPSKSGDLFVLGPVAAAAAEHETDQDDTTPDAPVGRPRGMLGLGATLRAPGVPFFGAALHTDHLTLSVEGIAADHSMFGIDARTQVLLGLARLRSPIAWHDWAPFADVGFVTVKSHAKGVDIGATGYTIGAGVERPMGSTGNWYLRGEARYVRLLDEPHWLAGVGVEWRLRLPEMMSRGGAGGRHAASVAGQYNVAAVHASGTVTGVSLPYNVSGSWEFSADFVNGTASVFLDGSADGESGSYAFVDATRVSFNGSSVSATFIEWDTHEDKPVEATISVSASPGGFSLSISARRSDGLSASARLYGTTSSFEVEPLVQEPAE